MVFPDYNHFLELQKDLSRTPSARVSVMVGAGLSLNSRPLHGVNRCFPTWRQLSRSFFDALYPKSPNYTSEQMEEREDRFKGSNALRLASEYEAFFGRGKLESLLRAEIPDSEHQPGEIHKLLLQLPWEDVFTTNYDTLLERTESPERAYQPVTTEEDIATAFPPRIVKLHGSFPSQPPFIITEEDYRDYPNNYALFVNTVRQSLAENTFVLVGFSGDDPNFLDWAGWIRNELGNRHNPIYLVSPLPLSNVDRSLLSRRGFTPIDLSPVVADRTPSREIHSSALRWFFENLLPPRPQRPDRWDDAVAAGDTAIASTPSVLSSTETETEEVDPSSPSQNVPEVEATVNMMKRWRIERNQYPGWLIPTDEIRTSLWQNTRAWTVRLINASKDWLPIDRLLLFQEINWRLETSMIPLDSGLMVGPFESVIEELLPVLTDGAHLESPIKTEKILNVSHTDLAEAWLTIAFALLREARENFDETRWENIVERIEKVVSHHPQSEDRFIYEKSLWLMWNLKRSDSRNLLATWSPSPQSPLAKMWKAGLLAELEELGEAYEILRDALQEIRHSIGIADQKIEMLSLEGWCTFLMSIVEPAANWEDTSVGIQGETNVARIPDRRAEFLERWEELRASDCDPWPLFEYFNKLLAADPPVPKKVRQITYGFDPQQRSVSYSLLGGPDTRWLPAFASIRLIEQVGIPVRLSGDLLKNATEWLLPFSGTYSPSCLISHLVRAGKTKELKEHSSMSRTRVASMEKNEAKRLNEWAMDALRREALSLIGRVAFQSAQASLLETLVEIVSRLTLKLESKDLHESFCLALELHKHPAFISHIRLNKACEPWFKRLFEAADDRQLLEWLPELLQFPLPTENEEAMAFRPNFWPDPMEHFPERRAIRDVGNDLEPPQKITQTIDWILERAKRESGEARQRALKRLIHISFATLMSEEQRKTLGILLWQKTGAHGLPDIANIFSSIYLHLPAPDKADAVSKVRAYLLTVTPRRAVTNDSTDSVRTELGIPKDEMILEVAQATKPVVWLPYESKGAIEWSLDETRELWRTAFEWWENDRVALGSRRGQNEFPFGTDYLLSRFEHLETFVSRIVLPKMDTANEDEWEIVSSFFTQARQHGVYLTTALPYLLLHRPFEKNKVLETILNDLSSDDQRAVKASARAIRHWIHLADAGMVEGPRPCAIDELIGRVIFRRTEGINTCLEQLELLLTEKPDVFTFEHVQLIVSSLTSWRYATCLPVSEGGSREFPEEERPELRVLLGRLASALSSWFSTNLSGKPEPLEISILRDVYSSDPLPEVRRSICSV